MKLANLIKPKFLIILFSIVLLQSCSKNSDVDLIVYNASIYTIDSSFSISEAMAVKDGKIVGVGSNEEIQKKYKSKENLNAE
ncbi:MAG: hypothetical protein ABIP68_04710, partial [Ferruginibacter sp.]